MYSKLIRGAWSTVYGYIILDVVNKWPHRDHGPDHQISQGITLNVIRTNVSKNIA